MRALTYINMWVQKKNVQEKGHYKIGFNAFSIIFKFRFLI